MTHLSLGMQAKKFITNIYSQIDYSGFSEKLFVPKSLC